MLVLILYRIILSNGRVLLFREAIQLLGRTMLCGGNLAFKQEVPSPGRMVVSGKILLSSLEYLPPGYLTPPATPPQHPKYCP